MKRKVILLGIIVFLPGFVFAQNRIIAVVGKQVITEKDLERYLRMLSLKSSQNQLDKNKVLEELIENKLLLEEAKKRKYKVKEEWIEKEIKKMKEKLGSQKAFLEFLKFQGLTLQKLKENIKNQILIEILIDEEVRSKIKIFPWEITKFYRKHLKQFTENRVKIRIKKISQAQAQQILTAKKVDLDIKEFKDLGWQEFNSLEKKLQDVLLTSPEKSFIGPIELEEDFYVVYLEKKRINVTKPLEDVKNQIYKELRKEKFKKRLKELLEELKKHIYVKIYS